MAVREAPEQEAHKTPSLAMWVASGLLLDMALFELLTLTPHAGRQGYIAVAMVLCWVHLAVPPGLVWLGRRPRWLDLGRVALAVPVAVLAVAVGGAFGLGFGFAAFLLLGLPGFPAGGACAAGFAAVITHDLLGPGSKQGPVARAMLSGAGAASIFGVGAIFVDLRRDIGPLVVPCAAIPALILIAPRRPSTKLDPRGLLWGASLTFAAAILIIVVYAVPQMAQRPVLDADGRHCLAAPDPDCLADTAFRLQAGLQRDAIRLGWTSEWPARRPDTLELPSIADNLVRAGHADQARTMYSTIDAGPSAEAVARETVARGVAEDAIVQEARAHPDRAVDLSPLDGRPVGRREAALWRLSQRLVSEPFGFFGVMSSAVLSAAPENVPTLKFIADRMALLSSDDTRGRGPGTQAPLHPRGYIAKLYADLSEPERARQILSEITSKNCGWWETNAALQIGDWKTALSFCPGTSVIAASALEAAAPAMRQEPVEAAEIVQGRFDRLYQEAPRWQPDQRKQTQSESGWGKAARAFVDVALDLGRPDLAVDMAQVIAERARGVEGRFRGDALVDAAAALIDIGKQERPRALLKEAMEAAFPGPTPQNIPVAVQLHRLGDSLDPSQKRGVGLLIDEACSERLADTFTRERRDADCAKASLYVAINWAYQMFDEGRRDEAHRALNAILKRGPSPSDGNALDKAAALARRARRAGFGPGSPDQGDPNPQGHVRRCHRADFACGRPMARHALRHSPGGGRGSDDPGRNSAPRTELVLSPPPPRWRTLVSGDLRRPRGSASCQPQPLHDEPTPSSRARRGAQRLGLSARKARQDRTCSGSDIATIRYS
jgi:hypothetical protein